MTAVTTKQHRAALAVDNHVVQGWDVENATAREAISLGTTDLGRIARQADTGSLYACVATSAPKWVQLARPYDTVQDLQALGTANGMAVGEVREVSATGNRYRCHTVADGSSTWIPVNGLYDVRDFGATGDGTTDDRASINAACSALPTDGGTVYFPPALASYAVSGPIQTATRGTTLLGASKHSSNITKLGAPTAEGLIEILHTDCVVDNLALSAGNTGYAVHVRGGPRATIRNNNMLAATDADGTGILLDNRNSAGIGVAGAYTHRIYNNDIGQGTNRSFQYGIRTDAETDEMNACRVYGNTIISDNAISWLQGGGNSFDGNLLQSLTGTTGTPVGTAMAFAETENAVISNYIEKFADDWTVTGSAAVIDMGQSHYDNNTRTARRSAHFLTGDGETVPVRSRAVDVSGNGALRTGTLIANGIYDGQELVLRFNTWGATFDSSASNLSLLTAGDFTGGNQSTNVKFIKFEWYDELSEWQEIVRHTRP